MSPPIPIPLTITAARRVARTRRGGYFRPDLNNTREIYIYCPLCHARIDIILPWAQIRSGPKTADLDGAVVEHLMCPDAEDRCPEITAVKIGRRS